MIKNNRISLDDLPADRQELARRENQMHELRLALVKLWNDFKLDPPISLSDKTQAAVTFAAFCVYTFHATQHSDMDYLMTKDELAHAVGVFRQALTTTRAAVLDAVGTRGKLN